MGYGCPVRPVLMWSEQLLAYDFGPGHPMDPVRLDLTIRLLGELGLLERFDVVAPHLASDADLALVHDPAYLAAVREASRSGLTAASFGLGDADTPVFAGMHEAAARIAGAALEGARLLAGGSARRVLSPAGGMHHAMPSAASGFCVHNDAALALAVLAEQGPVVYVDLDVHHGDGVQRAFEADGRVTTISIHQHPGSIYPHSGYPGEIGTGPGRGHSVNLALPEGVTDSGWLRAIEAVVEPVVREVRPFALVTQHGCDTHADDPLGGLRISIEAQAEAARMLADLAEEHAGGRWLALGGGGYDVVGVVPRVWAHVAAVVAGVTLDPALPTPPAWRRHVRDITGREAPLAMGDGVEVRYRPFAAGHDPADDVDRAIMATRNAAFPCLGLDPLTA